MAGRYIVNSSKFQPFSYAEMLAPVQMAQEAHIAVEEGLGELSAKAGIWDKLANQQTDPMAYAQYKAYADDLTKQADLLARQGLTPESRRGLIDMKRRYTSEITPIEVAAAKREELTKSQREAIQKDPSLMFNVDYGASSLDDLINNPNPTYNTISGSELSKRASMVAANLAKTIQDNPQYQSILGGQYFQQMQQLGYTPQQVMQTIMNDPNAPKELKNVADTIWQEAGLDTWDQATQARARDYINSGLYEAIGTQKYDTQGNRGYMTAAESRRLDLEEERLNMLKEQQAWARDEKLGYLMSDGTRVKPIGGGRVLVTNPDGSYGGIQTASTSSGSKPAKVAKSDLFTTLDYTGGGFGSPGGSDRFSESDAKQITFGQLSPKARKKLVEDLAKYELTPEDVDIYEDSDIFSRNHYRIVRKGAGVSGGGIPVQEPVSTETVTPQVTDSVSFDVNIGLD